MRVSAQTRAKKTTQAAKELIRGRRAPARTEDGGSKTEETKNPVAEKTSSKGRMKTNKPRRDPDLVISRKVQNDQHIRDVKIAFFITIKQDSYN
jgi:hypothetical protein